MATAGQRREQVAIVRLALLGRRLRLSEPAEFCPQCYGGRTVRLLGETVVCTCVSWPLVGYGRGPVPAPGVN